MGGFPGGKPFTMRLATLALAFLVRLEGYKAGVPGEHRGQDARRWPQECVVQEETAAGPPGGGSRPRVSTEREGWSLPEPGTASGATAPHGAALVPFFSLTLQRIKISFLREYHTANIP